MRRRLLLLSGLSLLALTGCVSRPFAENPGLIAAPQVVGIENPVLVAPGEPNPSAYAELFEKILDIVDDYFVIAYANRYDGRIESAPLIAPGWDRFWMRSTPDARERCLATLQTIRYRLQVQITAADPGGYRVQVIIYKELENAYRPLASRYNAVFRDAPTVDRRLLIVDSPVDTAGWIPKGRDCAFEQEILRQIQRCQ